MLLIPETGRAVVFPDILGGEAGGGKHVMTEFSPFPPVVRGYNLETAAGDGEYGGK